MFKTKVQKVQEFLMEELGLEEEKALKIALKINKIYGENDGLNLRWE